MPLLFDLFWLLNAETLDATVFTDKLLASIDSSRSGILGASEAEVIVDWEESRDAFEVRPFFPLVVLGAVVPAKAKKGQFGDRR